jgi:hypothetical protein
LEDPENTDFQYLVYNALGFSAKTLMEIDNISETKEHFCRNEKYFGEIIAACERLLAEEPDNLEYIENSLKALENIMAYHNEAKHYEEYAYFMGIVSQNCEKAFKIQPDNEELFEKMDAHIRGFIRHCLLFRKPGEAKEVIEQVEKIYQGILEKEPGNSLAFDNLISLYEETGDLYANLGDIEKTEEISCEPSSFWKKN